MDRNRRAAEPRRGDGGGRRSDPGPGSGRGQAVGGRGEAAVRPWRLRPEGRGQGGDVHRQGPAYPARRLSVRPDPPRPVRRGGVAARGGGLPRVRRGGEDGREGRGAGGPRRPPARGPGPRCRACRSDGCPARGAVRRGLDGRQGHRGPPQGRGGLVEVGRDRREARGREAPAAAGGGPRSGAAGRSPAGQPRSDRAAGQRAGAVRAPGGSGPGRAGSRHRGPGAVPVAPRRRRPAGGLHRRSAAGLRAPPAARPRCRRRRRRGPAASRSAGAAHRGRARRGRPGPGAQPDPAPPRRGASKRGRT